MHVGRGVIGDLFFVFIDQCHRYNGVHRSCRHTASRPGDHGHGFGHAWIARRRRIVDHRCRLVAVSTLLFAISISSRTGRSEVGYVCRLLLESHLTGSSKE